MSVSLQKTLHALSVRLRHFFSYYIQYTSDSVDSPLRVVDTDICILLFTASGLSVSCAGWSRQGLWGMALLQHRDHNDAWIR